MISVHDLLPHKEKIFADIHELMNNRFFLSVNFALNREGRTPATWDFVDFFTQFVCRDNPVDRYLLFSYFDLIQSKTDSEQPAKVAFSKLKDVFRFLSPKMLRWYVRNEAYVAFEKELQFRNDLPVDLKPNSLEIWMAHNGEDFRTLYVDPEALGIKRRTNQLIDDFDADLAFILNLPESKPESKKVRYNFWEDYPWYEPDSE